MSRRPGRPARGEQRDGRQALLIAAREMIRKEGIERLTLRAVAERAGVGSALVSYHFGNKEGLKEAVVEQAVTELRERILVEEIHGASPVTQLRGMIERMIEGLGAEPYIPRMIVELIASGDATILQKLASNVALPNLEIAQRVYSEGRRQGVFRDLRIDLVSPAIMGAGVYPLVIAPLIKAFLGLDLTNETHLRSYAKHTAELLLEGLKTRN